MTPLRFLVINRDRRVRLIFFAGVLLLPFSLSPPSPSPTVLRRCRTFIEGHSHVAPWSPFPHQCSCEISQNATWNISISFSPSPHIRYSFYMQLCVILIPYTDSAIYHGIICFFSSCRVSKSSKFHALALAGLSSALWCILHKARARFMVCACSA